MRLRTFMCSLSIIAMGAWATPPVHAEDNLLPNASFERLADDKPSGWYTKVWRGEGDFQTAGDGRTGEHCVMIASDEGGDLSWGIQVSVKPFSIYHLSGWIKTEDVEPSNGVGALFNIHELQQSRTPELIGTNKWTRVEATFETGERDTLTVHCLFGGWGLATGRAWYDDLKLELLSTKELAPSVTVLASQTGEPISDLIYGQFIEHLGRCIYGGIWAEMLEDRKFFHAVGSELSPWEAIGEQESVCMVHANSYVGEHTPRIYLKGDDSPRGIRQRGLALRAGKRYKGRIVLAGARTAGPIQVSLIWGDGPKDRDTVTIKKLGREFEKYPLRFKARTDTDSGSIVIAAMGEGTFQIGTLSLMPTDNVHGMRADTLALLQELDAPIYRWPGGNFVSGYDWRDGIGDPDKRPPRWERAWNAIEHNDFGIDEFVRFCREIDTEPLAVVNTGLGDVDMAVQMLEYCNGDPNTVMGRKRAGNGNKKPFGIIWWGIGNEMYGGWQMGHMPLDEYVQKHNRFVDAMRAVDASILSVAVGATGDWSETMMSECAGHMEYVSEHFYCGEQPGLYGHVRQIPNNVRRIANAHREYRKRIPALQERDIRIALDEWNYWYGPHLYGQLGTRYFLQDALGIAAGLNEMTRCTDIIAAANYAQTVNVIGCIKTSKTEAEFATTGLVLKLYRQKYGQVPIEVSGQPNPLDVAAAWTEDRKAITISVINPTQDSWDLALSLDDVASTGHGEVWRITGPDRKSYNAPGEEPQVRITEEEVRGFSSPATAPPMSVTLYKLRVQ